MNTECKEVKKGQGEFWLTYIGNIAKSYDFKNVFLALNMLSSKGIDDIRFNIFGDGDKRLEVESMAREYYPNTIITGYLPYSRMFTYLLNSDISINPIIDRSVSSVVNKVGDYAAAGIPVVNSSKSAEYRQLVEQYGAGLNAKTEDAVDISRCIERLYLDAGLRKSASEGQKKLYADYFDRRKTYLKILDALMV